KEEPGGEIPLTASAKELVSAWQASNFGMLKKATPGAIYRSLRSFKDWESLEPIAKKLINESKSSNCENPAMATALAQKAEMFFPEKKYRDLAFQLYERVVGC